MDQNQAKSYSEQMQFDMSIEEDKKDHDKTGSSSQRVSPYVTQSTSGVSETNVETAAMYLSPQDTEANIMPVTQRPLPPLEECTPLPAYKSIASSDEVVITAATEVVSDAPKQAVNLNVGSAKSSPVKCDKTSPKFALTLPDPSEPINIHPETGLLLYPEVFLPPPMPRTSPYKDHNEESIFKSKYPSDSQTKPQIPSPTKPQFASSSKPQIPSPFKSHMSSPSKPQTPSPSKSQPLSPTKPQTPSPSKPQTPSQSKPQTPSPSSKAARNLFEKSPKK